MSQAKYLFLLLLTAVLAGCLRKAAPTSQELYRIPPYYLHLASQNVRIGNRELDAQITAVTLAKRSPFSRAQSLTANTSLPDKAPLQFASLKFEFSDDGKRYKCELNNQKLTSMLAFSSKEKCDPVPTIAVSCEPPAGQPPAVQPSTDSGDTPPTGSGSVAVCPSTPPTDLPASCAAVFSDSRQLIATDDANHIVTKHYFYRNNTMIRIGGYGSKVRYKQGTYFWMATDNMKSVDGDANAALQHMHRLKLSCKAEGRKLTIGINDSDSKMTVDISGTKLVFIDIGLNQKDGKILTITVEHYYTPVWDYYIFDVQDDGTVVQGKAVWVQQEGIQPTTHTLELKR